MLNKRIIELKRIIKTGSQDDAKRAAEIIRAIDKQNPDAILEKENLQKWHKVYDNFRHLNLSQLKEEFSRSIDASPAIDIIILLNLIIGITKGTNIVWPEKNDNDVLVNIKQLAHIFDVDERTIYNYMEQGFLIKYAKGKFIVREAVQAYIQNVVGKNEDRYKKGRTRLIEAQAAKAELELKVSRREYLPKQFVVEHWQAIVTTTKTELLGLKNEIKMRMPHIENDDLLKIDELVRKKLQGLAKDGVPDNIIRDIAERYKSLFSPAELEGQRVGE